MTILPLQIAGSHLKIVKNIFNNPLYNGISTPTDTIMVRL